jgi:hypothetical protein
VMTQVCTYLFSGDTDSKRTATIHELVSDVTKGVSRAVYGAVHREALWARRGGDRPSQRMNTGSKDRPEDASVAQDYRALNSAHIRARL